MTFCYFTLNSTVSLLIYELIQPTSLSVCMMQHTFITLVTETYKSKENMVCIFMELSRHLPHSELSLIQRGLKPRQLYFVQMNKMYIVVVRTRPIFTQS